MTILIDLEGALGGFISQAKWAKTYTDIPNQYLPHSLKAHLEAFLGGLGVSLEETGHTVTVRVKEGKKPDLLGPAIFAGPGNGTLKWGDAKWDLAGLLAQASDYSIRESLSQKKDKAFYALDCFVESGDVLQMTIPMRLTSTAPGLTFELKRALKDGSLGGLLAAMPGGGGGEAHKFSELLTDETPEPALPVGTYQVIGATQTLSKAGAPMAFISVVGPGGNVLKYFAGKEVEKVLSTNPLISPECPATLEILEYVESVFQSKVYRKAQLTFRAGNGAYAGAQDEVLDLSFLG